MIMRPEGERSDLVLDYDFAAPEASPHLRYEDLERREGERGEGNGLLGASTCGEEQARLLASEVECDLLLRFREVEHHQAGLRGAIAGANEGQVRRASRVEHPVVAGDQGGSGPAQAQHTAVEVEQRVGI